MTYRKVIRKQVISPDGTVIAEATSSVVSSDNDQTETSQSVSVKVTQTSSYSHSSSSSKSSSRFQSS